MVKIILIAISALLVGLVITYSWFNRDSDRVVLTLVTAMTLGALGFITKESISNKVEKFTKTIPVAVFYSTPNYRPININLPYSFDLGMCMQNIDPNTIPASESSSVNIDFAQDMYFDAIQYTVIKNIFQRFSKSWNVEATRIRTPNGTSLSWHHIDEAGKEISISEFFEIIPNNCFAKMNLHKDLPKPFGGQATFPPGTKIRYEADEGNYEALITLSNKYIELVIKISKNSSSIGLGEYAKLLGIASASDRLSISDQNGYGNSVFMVEVNAKQSHWLNGHPEMIKHRNWANAIAELLDSEFNYNLIREDHMRQFQLYGPSAISGI